jgi:hypothetical protein
MEVDACWRMVCRVQSDCLGDGFHGKSAESWDFVEETDSRLPLSVRRNQVVVGL